VPKKKASLFGRLIGKAKQVKRLFRKNGNKNNADHCHSRRENMATARNGEQTDTVGAWSIDVSRQFG